MTILEFVNQAFKTVEIRESGTAIVKVMKPVSMFGTSAEGVSRSEKNKAHLPS
jgi:hypothetical protein